ncbi:PAS domain-containing protein [Limimaricola hongkongensis]|uniref:histidine kinase n=1 Tax=Limimaricola hongkongensis DSM 17492 TaxID=1122180 RepID=A0A017HHL5_9RHOB|nr:PAS domain-containing protein [Limimaricola hongkongensis]EYD73815.1 sensor histidine kinase [Limimaricola hongkongensis DSM 17492]
MQGRPDRLNEEMLLETIRHARLPLCITDPTLPDNPIVFANDAFCALTGYAVDEVIGRNCRFLQGANTTPDSIARIRRIIESCEVDTVEIVNYRKDGTAFLNALQIGPIMGDDGTPMLYFGSQLDTSTRREAERAARQLADRELGHRLRNIVNVMSVMIRMSAREATDIPALARTVEGRLKTLSDAHFRTIESPRAARLRELLRPILEAYAPNGAAQFDFKGPDPEVPADLVSALTLTVHELATNAVKHGALGDPDGHVAITMSEQDGLSLHWQERNGPEVIAPERHGGSGIIRSLVEGVGGTLDLDWHREGLVARLSFPTAR